MLCPLMCCNFGNFLQGGGEKKNKRKGFVVIGEVAVSGGDGGGGGGCCCLFDVIINCDAVGVCDDIVFLPKPWQVLIMKVYKQQQQKFGLVVVFVGWLIS